MALLAAVGLLASLVLTHDKIEALQAAARGETFSAGCDLNAFVSCSAVVGSAQSELFGFPNSFLGIVGFSVVMSLAAVAALGGRLPLVVLSGLQLGASAAIVLITWLQVQSIVVLQRLCPYCIAVWVVTIPIFVLTTRTFLLRTRPAARATRLLEDWTLLMVLLWYVAVAAAVWFRFGDRLWA
ncbi:hypothetical protein ASD11_12695 [Aeromicrobium sp. Root495]|nr:hypothetical protein ASD11_12695 [Aeromicrobium sp. Root495]